MLDNSFQANMMFCDRCDRGYHSYCVGLEAIPDGSWQCSVCDPSPTPPTSKGKRGRPSNRPSQLPISPKSEVLPTRVSSRRSRPPVSPSNNSNSSSIDPNSPTVNLVLTRHQQQWITTPSNNTINQKST